MLDLLPGIALFAALFVVVLALTKPLGVYMYRVFDGQRTILSPIARPLERAIYRASGIRPEIEQDWKQYAVGMLLFSLVGMLLLYAIQRLQQWLPLNPQALGPLSPDLSFGESASFATNTNWQSYVPETTVSYFTQMAGYAVHNFVSAATGMAIAVALSRGLARRSAKTIGNFWVDLVRATVYVLLPVSVVLAIVLVGLGVPQTFSGYATATTVEGAQQTIALGPVASQEIIKELGTNGGGFFNANSAHPFENPSVLTNFLEMLAILAISAAMTYTFGRIVGDQRQGWALFATMSALFAIGFVVALVPQQAGNSLLSGLGVDQAATATQTGGSFEGIETRFGAAAGVLWAVVTTVTSCGAVNAMHDSFIPISGMVPLVNIQLGEVVFGGVGAGLYGVLVYAILAVFIAGLMVGRTPEYLGKKVQSFEMKMVMLVVLVLALDILAFTAWASVSSDGVAGVLNSGPHGFTEMLYAFTSATGNNGSAFAGLSANTVFYNTTQGLAELVGRFLMIVPILAIAGSMAAKTRVPASLGTLPTHGPLFVGLLAGTILIVGALTFFPALALGPIVDQLLLNAGKSF